MRLAASDHTFTRPSKETHNLQSKHPASPENHRAAPATEVTQLQASEREIRSAIFSFPSGSAAGPSGLCPQHLKDAVSSSANETGNQLVASVNEFCNLFLRGDLPEFIKSVLSSATLIYLTEKCGGIRSIAIGEPLRRLTAKCVSRRMLRKFESFFEPLQLGEAAAMDAKPRHTLPESTLFLRARTKRLSRSISPTPSTVTDRTQCLNVLLNTHRRSSSLSKVATMSQVSSYMVIT